MCTTEEALMKTEAAPFVHAPSGRSQALKARPAIPAHPTLPRPPHPIPTSVTIAIRPSLRDGTEGVSK